MTGSNEGGDSSVSVDGDRMIASSTYAGADGGTTWLVDLVVGAEQSTFLPTGGRTGFLRAPLVRPTPSSDPPDNAGATEEIDLSSFVGRWSTHGGYLAIAADGTADMSYGVEGEEFANEYPEVRLAATERTGDVLAMRVTTTTGDQIPVGSTYRFKIGHPGLLTIEGPQTPTWCDEANREAGECGA